MSARTSSAEKGLEEGSQLSHSLHVLYRNEALKTKLASHSTCPATTARHTPTKRMDAADEFIASVLAGGSVTPLV